MPNLQQERREDEERRGGVSDEGKRKWWTEVVKERGGKCKRSPGNDKLTVVLSSLLHTHRVGSLSLPNASFDVGLHHVTSSF